MLHQAQHHFVLIVSVYLQVIAAELCLYHSLKICSNRAVVISSLAHCTQAYFTWLTSRINCQQVPCGLWMQLPSDPNHPLGWKSVPLFWHTGPSLSLTCPCMLTQGHFRIDFVSGILPLDHIFWNEAFLTWAVHLNSKLCCLERRRKQKHFKSYFHNVIFKEM